MLCREACAACCIAPSISSPLPDMPKGKPAGCACLHLDETLRCKLFGHPSRPEVCKNLAPEQAMCGSHRQEALAYLTWLEEATAPV